MRRPCGLFALDTKTLRAPLSLKDGDTGELSAVFSTFNVVDSDGDVVLPSAFTPGQAVPMVWSHQWDQPIGKGVVRVEPDRAIFDGHFFLDTTAGRDAYLTVRNMGALQEYSWGFQVLDMEPGTFDGQPVRFIKRTDLFEVSPVLVGANRDTFTLALKGHAPDHLAALVADLKRGARLSQASRTEIHAAIDALQRLLAEDAAADDTPDKTTPAWRARERWELDRRTARIRRELGGVA